MPTFPKKSARAFADGGSPQSTKNTSVALGRAKLLREKSRNKVLVGGADAVAANRATANMREQDAEIIEERVKRKQDTSGIGEDVVGNSARK